MNCPSRVDPELKDEWNQNPNDLAGDTTTCSDLGKLASARLRQDHKLKKHDQPSMEDVSTIAPNVDESNIEKLSGSSGPCPTVASRFGGRKFNFNLKHGGSTEATQSRASASPPNPSPLPLWQRPFQGIAHVLWKFMKFMGPGFMISVAYIDPGNYATDAAAGATFRFRLLFMILLSNIFAILLQSLCIKLSTITGLNLAEMNRAHCPPWLNLVLWFFGESAVIATDIAEVIGFAIALNLLAPQIPVVAGCAISIVDVMFILLFYRPQGSMAALRVFEGFVIILVIGVAICFCYQLSLIQGVSVGEVFKGYLPSSALVQGQGLYQACGILGATVMPHSLYLGSGLNQPRLRQYDQEHHNTSTLTVSSADTAQDNEYEGSDHSGKHKPSLEAIHHCMKYSIWELALTLFTFALFINSAILIICGASLSSVNGADNADLFGIYALLQQQVAPAAGTAFAVALLLSGCSAGVVCTMAGQMISEGQINWRMRPWMARLLTRSISIVPAILVAGTIGRNGLSAALVGSQVALSVILPFVSAPLIYYTSRNKYMTTIGRVTERNADGSEVPMAIKMRNHWVISILALLVWILIVVMNVANIVLIAIGVA